jgi:hypothetical protein
MRNATSGSVPFRAQHLPQLPGRNRLDLQRTKDFASHVDTYDRPPNLCPEVAKLVIDTPPPEALPLALLAVTVSVGP